MNVNFNVYLIKRGPRPRHHRAPYHPVIIYTLKHVAVWEAGSTSDRAWVWETERGDWYKYGWLLTRWNGFPIDYGFVVHSIDLPDGNPAAFWRPYQPTDGQGYIGDLFAGAVWWSHREMPNWFAERGVVYPSDDFTQQNILDITANDGCMGFERPQPEHWPDPVKAIFEDVQPD